MLYQVNVSYISMLLLTILKSVKINHQSGNVILQLNHVFFHEFHVIVYVVDMLARNP